MIRYLLDPYGLAVGDAVCIVDDTQDCPLVHLVRGLHQGSSGLDRFYALFCVEFVPKTTLVLVTEPVTRLVCLVEGEVRGFGRSTITQTVSV